MVVTDTDGRVLWRRGRTGVRSLADRLGFVPGSAWTEANVGTNAIGTCLVVGEPVHIRGPEHYVESHTRWSCAAAPVLDPWTGATLGAIDVSGPAQSVQRTVLALVGVTARLAEAHVRNEHAASLERLRAHAAPVVARVGGRALAVDPNGHIAAVTGFAAPDRLVLPADISADSTWLPALGDVTVEPLPGGWLVRLGAETAAATELVLDLRTRPVLRVRTPSQSWEHRPSPRHAEILLALIRRPEGRTAAQLADDLFADPTRVVTVRAEMSRLRRTLGSVLEAQPYRIAPAVRAAVLLPDEGTAIAGSSAPGGLGHLVQSTGRARCGARRRSASLPDVDEFDDLLQANRAFADSFDLGGFDGRAHAGIALVTCMDSRIDPLRMLGLQHGDAKIFRNPGGRVTPQALEALVLGVHLLNVQRILVVPHTRCAMASSSEAELRVRVGESAGVDASWQSFGVVTDQLEQLREDVVKVRTHPLIGKRAVVGGFLYDVDTGLLTQHA